jgi:hypothetical protein
MQQLQPFLHQLVGEQADARGATARSAEAEDKALLGRVVALSKGNRIGRSCDLGCQPRTGATGRECDGDVTTDKIGRQRRPSIELTFRPTKFDRDVLAFDTAGSVQALAERGNERRPLCRRHAGLKPDHRYRRCLCATGERRDEDAACKTTDERSPIHYCLASPTNAGPPVLGPTPG